LGAAAAAAEGDRVYRFMDETFRKTKVDVTLGHKFIKDLSRFQREVD